MDEREIIAKNLTKLRERNHLTQAELAEKINYSDKSISKWERGEAVPDVLTLKKVATILGADVNYILEYHADEDAENSPVKKCNSRYLTIVTLSFMLVWLVATIIYAYSVANYQYHMWQAFICAAPISSAVLLFMGKPWRKNAIFTFTTASVMLWTLLAAAYLCTIQLKTWAVFIIGIPAQIIIILRIKLIKN